MINALENKLTIHRWFQFKRLVSYYYHVSWSCFSLLFIKNRHTWSWIGLGSLILNLTSTLDVYWCPEKVFTTIAIGKSVKRRTYFPAFVVDTGNVLCWKGIGEMVARAHSWLRHTRAVLEGYESVCCRQSIYCKCFLARRKRAVDSGGRC